MKILSFIGCMNLYLENRHFKTKLLPAGMDREVLHPARGRPPEAGSGHPHLRKVLPALGTRVHRGDD